MEGLYCFVFVSVAKQSSYCNVFWIAVSHMLLAMTEKFMALTAKDVTKIARLARLKVSDAEKEHYAAEIGGILQWIEQLQEVNTDGVPQMVSVADVRLPWRADVVTDGNQAEAIIKNAPQSDYGCFGVPKVIE